MHETERYWCAVGDTASPGGRAVAQGPGGAGGGAPGGFVAILGKPLEGGHGKGRLSGVGGQGSARTTGAPIAAAEGALVAVVVAGTASPWLCQSALDSAPGGASDREELRHKLSPGARLEDLTGLRLERAKASTAGAGERRRADPAVAAKALAAYKKRRASRGVASSSWTKAASCFSRWCGGLGRPEGTRRGCASGIDTIDCRLSAPSAYRPSGTAWACIGRRTVRGRHGQERAA